METKETTSIEEGLEEKKVKINGDLAEISEVLTSSIGVAAIAATISLVAAPIAGGVVAIYQIARLFGKHHKDKKDA